MQTTPTFDAIHGLVKRQFTLLDQRDAVREQLRGTLTSERRKELEIEFWHLVGQIDGLGQAFEALRAAGENVSSAQYLAIEERRQAVTA